MNEEFNKGVIWLGSTLSIYLIVAISLVLVERSAGINSPEESPSLLARSSLVFGPLSILVVLPAFFFCRKAAASPSVRWSLVLLNLIGIICAVATVYWAYPIASKNVPWPGP